MGVESSGGTRSAGDSEEEGEKRCFSRAVKICSLKSHQFFKKFSFFPLTVIPSGYHLMTLDVSSSF